MNQNGISQLLRQIAERASQKQIRSEIFWVAATMVLQLSGQLALVKILTTRLDPSQYGLLGLHNSGVQLCELVLFVPFLQSAMRLAPTGEGRKINLGPFRAARRYWRFLWLPVFAVALAVCGFFAHRHAYEYGLLTLAGCFVLWAELQREYWVYVAFILRLRKIVAVVYGLDAWFRCLVCALFLSLIARNAVMVSAGMIVVTVFAGHLARNLMSKRLAQYEVGGECTLDRAGRRHMLDFAVPWASISACTWGQRSLDRWVVAGLLGTYSAGLYVGASQLGTVAFSSLSALIIGFAGPVLYHEVSRAARAGSLARLKAMLAAVYAAYWALGGIGIALFIAFRHFAIALLLGPKYMGTMAIVAIIALGALILNGSQLQVLSIMVSGHTHCLLLPEIVSGVVAVLLDFYFIAHYGMMGAAWALVCTATLRLALMAWASARAWRKPPVFLEPLAQAEIALAG